jgi:hypothetical protein
MRAMAIIQRSACEPGGVGNARRPVVVAVVSGKGGVGTTATAAGAALAGAAAGPTAAVSVRSGPGSLHHHFAHRAGPARPDCHAAEPVTVTGPRVAAVTVVDSGGWHPWSPQGDVVSLVGRLRDGHPLTIVDIGDAQGHAAHRLLARADRVVLVTTPAADAVASAGTALDRVRHVDPARLAAMVLVVVCLDPRQHRWAGRRLRSVPGAAGSRTVLVPYDPAVAARTLPAPGPARAWPAYQRIAGLLTGLPVASGAAVPR